MRMVVGPEPRLHLGSVGRAAQGHGEELPQKPWPSSASRSCSAPANGINEKQAAKIFELMDDLRRYGFNSLHSTAYAFLAYQMGAQGKFPKTFCCSAAGTIEKPNTRKLAVYIAECRERGIAVLPPDINESQLHFSVVPVGVRFGLGQQPLKKVSGPKGRSAPSSRCREPAAASPRSTSCGESDCIANKKVFEALVKSGACDCLIPSGILAAGRETVEPRPRPSQEGEPGELGQSDLFGGGEKLDRHPHARCVTVVRDGACRCTRRTRSACNSHPIDRHAGDLRAFGAKTVGDLDRRFAVHRRLAGPLDCRGRLRRRRSRRREFLKMRKGDAMKLSCSAIPAKARLRWSSSGDSSRAIAR